MIVNRAMARLPMCVSRICNMIEPLYSNPHKDPSTVEALNNTQVPLPFEVPKVAKKINKESPTLTIITTAATSEVMVNDSVKNMALMNTVMDEIQPVRSSDNYGLQQPGNGTLQLNASPLNDKSLPSSVTPSPGSAVIRTYTPLTNSSEEDTASEPDSKDNTLGLVWLNEP